MNIFNLEKTQAEKELDRQFKLLQGYASDSEEYATVLDRIAKLHKLAAEDKPPRVSRDTLVVAGVNLLGIIMILKHEELNVITTKAMSLVPRTR